MIKPTTRKNKNKIPGKFTTIRHKRKFSTRKQKAGAPPSLNTITNASNNTHQNSMSRNNDDDLNYFYEYFGPNFLQNCEKPEEVKLITQNDKQLCEQFGLHMLKKVSLISGIYKLQDELQVQQRVNLSPAEIQKINLLINDRQSKVCQDNMPETKLAEMEPYKSKVINLLANVYNVNIIRGLSQKIISQPDDKLAEYFDSCTDEDYSDATELVKDVITEFYFGENKAKCILTKEIMTLLKIIGAITKLIEHHKIPQPTNQPGSNNHSSSRLYLYDLLEYSINELTTKLGGV